MLEVMTILIMVAVAYVYLNEGLFTSFCMFCSVLTAGLVAFDFWEPLADLLSDTFVKDYADAICLTFLFSLTLGLIRLATNSLAHKQIEFHPALQSIGGAGLGLATGYLLSGFLVCVFQTLPWHENFMGFKWKYEADQVLRKVLPPDRVWLAMMNRAGTYSFSTRDATFDKDGTFELRYGRYRRYPEKGVPMPYTGEFSKETSAER